MGHLLVLDGADFTLLTPLAVVSFCWLKPRMSHKLKIDSPDCSGFLRTHSEKRPPLTLPEAVLLDFLL